MIELWTIQENNGLGWILLRDAFLSEQEANEEVKRLKTRVLSGATYKVRPVRIERGGESQ